MSNLAIRLSSEALRSSAFGAITGVYSAIGTAFLNPIRLIYVVNTTDVILTFSLDGVADSFVLPSEGFLLLDVTTNRTDTGGCLYLPQGQIIYVKGTPTLGTVYLSTFYGAKG